MNRRIFTLSTGASALAAFGGGAWLYSRRKASIPAVSGEDTMFVRPHSPIIGNPDARVTIVEFFDPACEACRAFHPFLKDVLSRHPEHVRLALRYTPFHRGSDEAIRILEAARRQNLFEVVLLALYARQPEWAAYGAPTRQNAWRIAGTTRLNLERAELDASSPAVDQALEIDRADIQALSIRQTPTFFVNQRPLPSFGQQQLYNLVMSELEAMH